MPENEAGSFSDICIDGEIRGRALRTHAGVRPVFVSVGNGMDIEQATALSLLLTDRESHIPLPTRHADLQTHLMRSRLRDGNTEEL